MNNVLAGWIVWAGRKCDRPTYPIRLSRTHPQFADAAAVAARLRKARPAYQFTIRSLALSERLSAMYASESKS